MQGAPPSVYRCALPVLCGPRLHRRLVVILSQVSPPSPPKDGRPPNQEATATYLLEQRADVYARDAAGWNPLVHAAANGFEDLVDVLVYRILAPDPYPTPDPMLAAELQQDLLVGRGRIRRVSGLTGRQA